MSKLADRTTRAEFETLATVFSQGRNRQVIIELFPTHFTTRLKGTRKAYPHTYDSAFVRAMRATIEQERKAKKQKRKGLY